jgi:ABC-2 type transport system ATP-binding protein
MKYAVETISLTKIFSDWWGRSKVYAVDGLDLQVRDNEIFGLLGPNGSGKTTTLKMLLGLLYPTKGRSVVLGGDGSNPKINARIGFLPEESYLYRYLSARETLDFYGRLFGLGRQVRKMRIEALLDMVGLKAMAGRPVGTFSKGMARRIGLAQALINDPDLLILDEPTTGLDPIGTRQIKDLIIQLAKRGKTILLCSHLLADVEDVCDRIAILYGGKIQSEGRVSQLLQQTTKKQITTGSISDTAVERIKQIVADEQAECTITTPMDRLETFFIKTVAAAQKQRKPTSGAVSTTGIGDFLTSQDRSADILDKLVSAPLSQRSPAAPSTDAEPETAEPKPDDQLLDKLTAQSAALGAPAGGHLTVDEPNLPKAEAGGAVGDEESRAEQVEGETKPDQQVEKSILDQLTDDQPRHEGQETKDDESA